MYMSKEQELDQSFNVDEALTELEKINQQLSDKDISLNDSLDLYKKGVELAAKCQEHLVGVEKELQEINS